MTAPAAPAALPETIAALDIPRCEATWEFLGLEAPCGEPAAGRFTRICVHEHVREGLLCPYHAETGLCQTCWKLPGGVSHECPITIAEVTR